VYQGGKGGLANNWQFLERGFKSDKGTDIGAVAVAQVVEHLPSTEFKPPYHQKKADLRSIFVL
jgi:hypothetical protein